MNRLVYLSIALLSFTAASAQTITIEEYVNTYKEIAIKEMIRTGVPASITLAQGIVETESGNSKLVRKSNNHFGIKCKETWTGPSVSHDDDAPGECFRKYENAEQSYVDHSDFLRTRKHYNFLFGLDPADYKAWAFGLKKAGYATNPAYPQMLIKYIEKYNLNDYSLIALGKKQSAEPIFANKEQPVTVAVQQPAVQKAVQQSSDIVKEEIKKPVVNYPSGEFKINDTKVVYARQGTSYLAIAQQYNVPLKWLFDFNDLKEAEALEKDQLVYLQRKRRTGANQFHVVATGETLYDIAQAQGIRLDALLQLNYLPVNKQPAPGEQLYLQSPAAAAPKLIEASHFIAQPQ
jgi:LysM repeat protein